MTHAVAYIPMFHKQFPKLQSLFDFTVKANNVCVCAGLVSDVLLRASVQYCSHCGEFSSCVLGVSGGTVEEGGRVLLGKGGGAK